MSDEKVVKPRSGCLGKFLALFAMAGIAGLGAALWFLFQPQDLSAIAGTGPASAGKSSRNLQAVLKSSVERAYPITLSEEEINLYLRRTLEAKQGGLLESAVEFRSVCVRLEDDLAEIIMERSVMGHPFTVSMFVRVEQNETLQGVERSVFRDGGPYLEETPRLRRGGRFGKLVIPQGFLLLVLPSFEKFAAVYQKEISEGIEEMSRITIQKGKLVLDPRPDGGTNSALETF